MKVKGHYEKYWNSKTSKEEFEGYERNLVLPDLFKRGEYVLDLGCGDGVVSEYLKKVVRADIIGADISTNALSVAKKRGVETKLIDAEKKLPFKSNEFDAVFWGDNVEHLFNPEDTLAEIKRVLRKEGKLVMSCPNMGYWRYRLHYLLHGHLADTEWTGNPPWAWSHIRFFNQSTIRDFLKSQGFRIKRVIGVNRRFPDRLLTKFLPSLFGMIMVIEAKAN